MKLVLSQTQIESSIQASNETLNLIDSSFSTEIVIWQKKYGRHTLPWQNTQNPYYIWLSEIMLQQTQVNVVIPYYNKFLQKFPDIKSLAISPISMVLAYWSGLGYYARARNLHRCAQLVLSEYNGYFPDDLNLLINLPGIGRSTAAAIIVFAYDKCAAILDGNVKRVFSRVFGVTGLLNTKLVEDKLWHYAITLLPQTNIKFYTQGLMDLGATLCVRSKPDCDRCPVKNRCIALITNRINELPMRQSKKKILEKKMIMLIINSDEHVLLEQRSNRGIWGGLLSLPEILIKKNIEQLDVIIDVMIRPFGKIVVCRKLAGLLHTFTHFKLHAEIYQVVLKNRFKNHSNFSNYIWYAISALTDAPLPKPIKKILIENFS